MIPLFYFCSVQLLQDANKAVNNREIHSSIEERPQLVALPVNEQPPQRDVKSQKPTPIPSPDNGNALPNFYIHDGVLSVYQASVPAFVHVPRSGGTSMEVCFNKTALYFGNKTPKILDHDGRKRLKTLFKNAKITSKAYRLYAGDRAFGICEDIPDKDCSYIIFFRNPYDRLVSAYFACREGEGHAGYPLDCHTTDIQDWVIPISSTTLEQIFTQFNCLPIIDKENWFIPRYECDYKSSKMNTYAVFSANEDLIQYALDSMDKTFALIGLTEEFVVTLQLLQNAFNFPFYEECKELFENKGTFADANAKEQAKQTLMSNPDVQQALSADLRIYDKAKELFELQKQKLAAMFS